jgi:hypothetical protein
MVHAAAAAARYPPQPAQLSSAAARRLRPLRSLLDLVPADPSDANAPALLDEREEVEGRARRRPLSYGRLREQVVRFKSEAGPLGITAETRCAAVLENGPEVGGSVGGRVDCAVLLCLAWFSYSRAV